MLAALILFCVFIRKSFSQLCANCAWQFKTEQRYLQPGSQAHLLLCSHLCMYGSEGFCFSSPYIWCVLPALCIMSVLFFFRFWQNYFLVGPLGDGPSCRASVSHLHLDKIPRISCTSPEDLQRPVGMGSLDSVQGSSLLLSHKTLGCSARTWEWAFVSAWFFAFWTGKVRSKIKNWNLKLLFFLNIKTDFLF